MAVFSALAALVLQVLSTLSYPKAGEMAPSKLLTQQKYHNWAVVMALIAIYFGVMCLYHK